MSNIEAFTDIELAAKYPDIFRLRTLQNWRLLKKGPRYLKVGRRVLYPRQEIERFIESCMVDTAECAK